MKVNWFMKLLTIESIRSWQMRDQIIKNAITELLMNELLFLKREHQLRFLFSIFSFCKSSNPQKRYVTMSICPNRYLIRITQQYQCHVVRISNISTIWMMIFFLHIKLIITISSFVVCPTYLTLFTPLMLAL